MKDYSGSAILGFILSSTLGWGDIANALILGMVGALGGIVIKFIYDWGISLWKNRNKKISK